MTSILCLESPHNLNIVFFFFFKFSCNYKVRLSTKYAVLQFESSLFFFIFADMAGVCTREGGGIAGVMWSDAEPLASPWGKCRLACLRSAWRRTDAPDTWGRWIAGRAGGAAAWQTCDGKKRARKLSLKSQQILSVPSFALFSYSLILGLRSSSPKHFLIFVT